MDLAISSASTVARRWVFDITKHETPSILAMLLSDLFIGIANRMAPQVQISFLMWSLKAFIGIAMVWLAWGVILKQLNVEAVDYMRSFVHISKHF